MQYATPRTTGRVCGIVFAAVLSMASASRAQQSGMIFAADLYTGATDLLVFWEPIGSLHMPTRAADTVLGVSYGVIDWQTQINTASAYHYPYNASPNAQRNLNWDPAGPDDQYERFGHWGNGSSGDPCRRTRGLVRYDEDTFLLLSSQRGRVENANGDRPASLMQLEYRGSEATDNQVYDWNEPTEQVNYLMRAACAPFSSPPDYFQWGPRPCEDSSDPNFVPAYSAVDWTWTGGGVTGKLQIADATTISKQFWRWDNLGTSKPYDYVTFDVDTNFKYVEDAYGGTHTNGTIASGTVYETDRENGVANDGPILDLAVYYGETENHIYTSQYEGRIYELVGAKTLGFRRMTDQASAGAAVVGTSYAKPIIAPGSAMYASDFDSGSPTLGDDPSGPNGAGITTTRLFNEDPATPGQPWPTGRHYTGLAVDAGGRLYAASERIVDTASGEPVVAMIDSTTGAVLGGDPNAPYTLTDTIGSPFGQAGVGDKVLLVSGSGTTVARLVCDIASIDSVSVVTLDADPGTSLVANVHYKVYSADIADPLGRTFETWTSEAVVDVFHVGGGYETTIDLNALAFPNTAGTLGSVLRFGTTYNEIKGVVVAGDLEVDPYAMYGQSFAELGGGALDPLPADVTRLWISTARGDGNRSTYDGPGILVVDVTVDPDGTVASATLFGAIEDAATPLGRLSTIIYTEEGFDPWSAWENYNDVEFDGHGAMAYVGGRGPNENRYWGIKPGELAAAVAEMESEASGSGDALVGVTGFPLYMNLYGYGTCFGLAFDTSPLTNSGSVFPNVPSLVGSDPAADGTLAKKVNNVIRLTFDGGVSLPAGAPVTVTTLGQATDLSGMFSVSLDTTTVANDTLVMVEDQDPNGLANLAWYRLTPADGWVVGAFEVDLFKLIGDANGDGRVMAVDLGVIWAHNGQITDTRYDINGDGRVMAVDLGVAWSHNGETKTTKP